MTTLAAVRLAAAADILRILGANTVCKQDLSQARCTHRTNQDQMNQKGITMKTIRLTVLASLLAGPVMAQETREMDAHVHGVSALQLAVENGVLEMNLTSPGVDIVGFEYEASTDSDKDAVEAAIRKMLVPENMIALPEAAECRVSEVLAHLHGGDHGDQADEMHYHAGEADHDEHAEDHATGEGHDHKDDDHKDDDHNEADHEEHGTHSEFHARYIFACAHPEELTTVGFPFFAQFLNAQEIEAQFVTDAGAGAAEITRDQAELKLN